MLDRIARAALFAAVLLVPVAAGADDLLPVAAFAKHPQLSDPSLSPDGKHLAVRMDGEDVGEHALVIYAVDNLQTPVSLLRMPRFDVPMDITWVSPTRLVLAKAHEEGSLDKPAYYGELLATDINGKNQDYIYGYEEAVGSRRSTRNPDNGWGYIEGRPEEVNGHFYMRTESWNNHGNYSLYDVDAVKNTRHLLTDFGADGISFMVGADGLPHYAYGDNDNFEYVVYHYANGSWAKLDRAQVGSTFTPLYNTPDRQRIYAAYNPHGGPAMLVEQDELGGNRKVLAKDDFASIGSIQWTAQPYQPFATIPATGLPKVSYIDPSQPTAVLHKAISEKFPGSYVHFLQFSDDGSVLMFKVSSDRDPGTYYLIDTHTYKVRTLFAVEPWIDPARMAERRPLHFTASDGLELEAILTLPPGAGEKNLPMVLLPHGGPNDVQDNWFYDGYAQFLSSRGYLVLQVNYRGSSGRGNSFRHASYQKWGTRVQQDLIDGVKWAIAGNYADPQRICVFGGSFGGYSAMMTTIRAPGLFKCAVGYAGVYDLAMMHDKGDIQERKLGRSYLNATIGTDDAELATNSPDKLVAQINVPVLLVHGEDDQRAPFAQAKAMRAALDAAHKPYEWMSKPGEGHGFYDEKNTEEFLNLLQAFLAKHIGPGAAATATAAAP